VTYQRLTEAEIKALRQEAQAAGHWMKAQLKQRRKQHSSEDKTEG